MSILSIMATVSIAFQTPMAKIFGEKACYVFWMANAVYTWKMEIANFRNWNGCIQTPLL